MIEKIRGQIREFVRQWRIRRAANAWRRHHKAFKRAKRAYLALTAAEPAATPLAIAATAFVMPEPVTVRETALRRCATHLGYLAARHVSLTTLTGRQRGRHFGVPQARTAPRQSTPARSTARPVGAHRSRAEATTATARRAIGDLTSHAGRQIRRHYAPRSWGFDNHRSRLWSIAGGWAATA